MIIFSILDEVFVTSAACIFDGLPSIVPLFSNCLAITPARVNFLRDAIKINDIALHIKLKVYEFKILIDLCTAGSCCPVQGHVRAAPGCQPAGPRGRRCRRRPDV